ncbi:dihydroflavonol-4-reductase [Chryseobacterium sp. SORGH_AS 447]|uniref:SDR family NAD(P)-dependent oxidoreductase n=1 Tax=Chryseobacterium sp. SORGH_AS_0447 TaxID=3041769 RepID=UPI0027860FCB|nr:SDR family NAD(P)-dependent oxidoreductase [Chryseobacterium sp. SORGH_AS_0447]MDQ1160003.1 dihydroflavonol-4-reductase [Chryseobacterium sp. SORGH_AS_0447]
MVLVTGATGILGRVIVLELLKQGKKVRAAKRESSDLEDVRKSFAYYTDNPDGLFNAIEWTDTDLNDKNSIGHALQGISEVYHCAAKVSYDPADREKAEQVNVAGTENMLECCLEAAVHKFLYVSSAIVFAKEKEDGLIHESSAMISGKEATVYAASKCKADTAVFEAFHKGMNTVIINPGMIIGSGNWKNSSGEFLRTFMNGFYTFSGGTGCADVRDVAAIAIRLMDENRFGERYLISSENKTYRELSAIITERVQKTKPVVLSKPLLTVGRILNILTFRSIPFLRLLTRPNIAFLTSFQGISNHKVVSALEYEFIPVEESLIFHISNYLSEKS